jgi:branched-chain amino acid aminotransferase
MLELMTDAGLDLGRSDARHGYGLFETIAVRGGSPRRLRLHLERLAAGAAFLGLDAPPGLERLEYFIEARAGIETGVDGVLHLFALDGKLIVSFSQGLPERPERAESGIARSATRNSGNPLHRHKTLSYLENRLIASEARKRGAFDLVAVNERGLLCDGGKTNFFAILGDGIVTPPLTDGCLPGIARRLLIESGLAREESLSAEGLASVRAAFLANSLRGAIPLCSFEGRILDPAHALLARAAELLEKD